MAELDVTLTKNFADSPRKRRESLGYPPTISDIQCATAWTATTPRASGWRLRYSSSCRTRRHDSRHLLLARTARHRWREERDKSTRHHHHSRASGCPKGQLPQSAHG